MKNRLIDLIKLLLCMLCFFGTGYLVTGILKVFGIDIRNFGIGYKMLLELVLAVIVCVIITIIYYKDLKKDFKLFKKNINKNITYIIKMFLLFMIVKYIVGLLSNLIIIGVGYDLEKITSINQSTIEEYVKSFPLVMVFTTSVFAPIYEETLFRLGFRKVIRNRILFVLVSGFLFGILHIFPLQDGVDLVLGILQSISYVTMGIFLAYSYQKTDNIFTSIGIHFLNNFISVLTMINMM